MSMKPFKKYFDLNTMNTPKLSNIEGWITSCLLLGSCAGVLVAGHLSENYGRKITLQTCAVIYIIAAILTTVEPSGLKGLVMLSVGRVLSGASSGGASVAGTAYIAEISPKVIRGGLAALYNANTMLGVSLAYWINYGSLIHISSLSNAQWQIPLAMQALPGVILVFGLIALPESPR